MTLSLSKSNFDIPFVFHANTSGAESKEQALPHRPSTDQLTNLPQQFLIRGICYQLHERPPGDPLRDERIDDLRRDIVLFQDLGVNTLFIFKFDAGKTHDVAMKALKDAGIYVFVVLSTATMAINRQDPTVSYNEIFMNYLFHKVDVLAQYPNVIGVIAASQVIHERESTLAAPVIRAVVRDLKAYIKLKASLTGQRIIPVGVQAADVTTTAMPQAQYLTAGEPGERVDFYCCNNYHWAHESSLAISGWSHDVSTYGPIQLPLFLAEYGTKIANRNRTFHETTALFSPTMTGVFSGGCVYEFLKSRATEYGLVGRNEDGSMRTTEEFETLKERLRESRVGDGELEARDQSGLEIQLSEAWRGGFPAASHFWPAMPAVPPTVVDWGVLAARIVEAQEE